MSTRELRSAVRLDIARPSGPRRSLGHLQLICARFAELNKGKLCSNWYLAQTSAVKPALG